MKQKAISPVNAPISRTGPMSVAKTAERFSVLQPQEVILGLFGEYVKQSDHVWSGGLVNILGDLGFSTSAARMAINRVCLRELLAPVREGRYIFYVITPRLTTVLEEGRHKTFSQSIEPEWNGKWTFVLYFEPTIDNRGDRSRLGRWLGLRDFGVLQEGTWISPGDGRQEVHKIIDRLGITSSTITFVASITDPDQIQSIVNRTWDLRLLTHLYEKFLVKFSPMLDLAQADKLSPKQALVGRTRLIEMFRKMTLLDPNLPDEKLGVLWKRKDALLLFHELHSTLLEPATSYFTVNTLKTG